MRLSPRPVYYKFRARLEENEICRSRRKENPSLNKSGITPTNWRISSSSCWIFLDFSRTKDDDEDDTGSASESGRSRRSNRSLVDSA